jgi:hypothetical protein
LFIRVWLLPGWRALSPCPVLETSPKSAQLDFALVDANHALNELHAYRRCCKLA